jgi:N-methylhydantoinase B
MDGISIDPVKRELIKNALRTICDNMIVLVIRTSRSVVVKNNLDFSSSILDSNGEMVVQGLSLPAHLGATMPALKGCMDYFGDDIHEGDILCSNDPYAGASHLNDIFMFRPLYVAGQRVAFLCLILHHTDMGGRVPGTLRRTDAVCLYRRPDRLFRTSRARQHPTLAERRWRIRRLAG